MTVLPVLARIASREVALEAAGRDLASVVVPFVVAATLLAGLAFGPVPEVLTGVAPGLSWLVVLFAATPLARGVAAAERDEGSWDLLRTLTPATALFGGKLLSSWLWLTATWAVASLLIVVLFAAPLPLAAVPAGVLGALGLSAVTVTFGTVLVGADARTGLLAVLLLPAGLPVLLAGAQASVSGADPLPWLGLLVAYDLIALVLAWAVFPVLLEE